MIAVKNRMLICYEASSQLWIFDPDPNNIEFVDRYDFGTTGPLTLFYDQVMLDTQRSPRLFELTGFNYQALTDTNVGEALTDFGRSSFIDAAFWPWFGGFVAFGSLTNVDVYAEKCKLFQNSILRQSDTQYGFYILSFSKESQTVAWSWNPVPGLTNVLWRSMSPMDEKMYFVGQNNTVYYLKGDASGDEDTGTFVDETTDAAIVSRATTHYSYMGAPGQPKRLISIDVAKSGPVQISGCSTPWTSPALPSWGPIITDVTVGTPRIPLHGTATAWSLTFQCSDPAGFELQLIDLKYILGSRQ